MTQKLVSTGIYIGTGIIGIAIFLYPFFLLSFNQLDNDSLLFQSGLAPLLTLLLLLISLIVLFLEVQGQAVSAKLIASLGVLVAATAALRFLEVAIPGPGGFSPMFVPIILAGYVFGARFGFLMGTLSMLVSALITGGVGPWLPYQMFAAGWIGLTSGWLPHFTDKRIELGVLVIFGVAWGIVYGVALNLYFWPFIAGNTAVNWESSSGTVASIKQYSVFYLATSFVWDLARAAGNALLIFIVGLPTIKILSRFKDKYQFEVKGV